MALLAVVMVRVNATYWIGRGAAAGMAGAARMPLSRYLPAAIVGSAIWAFVYATIGLAAIDAWLAVMATSPLSAVLLVLALAGLAVGLVIWRRRRTAVAPEDTVV